MYRTHTCGELGVASVGLNVELAGFVNGIRDHGGVLFLDLRDYYGVVQLVTNDADLFMQIEKETVISVSGQVRARSKDTINTKISTGLIEVLVDKLEVLGKRTVALPFEIDESMATKEDIRLKYRFLDLRNKKMQDNIILRSKVISHIRQRMEKLGFIDIQTPILTASSPEGARDYLVPSRKHHGAFYALPQAPQQFKQLLMVSGFDKYYQIAPCFRDEDARADRSPGEFYQLDFELAYAHQEDVFKVAEEVLGSTFKKFSTKKISKAPFKRIPYKESMLRYGTDKPDLRNPLLIEDVTDYFIGTTFAPFKNKPIRGIVVKNATKQPKSFYEKMLDFATSIGMKGLGYISAIGKTKELKGPIVKFLTEEKQRQMQSYLEQESVIFFICDEEKFVSKLAGQIRTELARTLNLIDESRFEFCFIVDFPMYQENEESGAIEFTHNPFSMPQGGLDALMSKNPLDINAYQYDIVCNGVELSSGAVRNHRPDIMLKAFFLAGYSENDIKTKFAALYNAFSFGAPPHAGMAPGIDRIVMLLANQANLREVVAFPMNGNAQDVLLGAPSIVTEQQLRDVHIKIR